MGPATGTGEMSDRALTNRDGFTLIEIIIVLSIIGLLLGLAVPQYKNSVLKARETVLKENLFVLRKTIDQYRLDKGKYPPSLQTLVQDGYLRAIPVDPVTRSSETWVELPDAISPNEDISVEPPGIVDVKSGSPDKSPADGSLYNTW